MKIATKTEELRAIEMSKAQVHAEMAIKKAEGDALSSIKKAEGEANALRLTADASRYAKEQEAEGIRAFFEAQSDGLRRLRSSFGNDASTLQFLMMDKGILETLARANAEAVKGMNPKITVWNTSSDGKSDYTKTVADVVKMIPPLTIALEQSGFKIPDLFKNTPENVTTSSPPSEEAIVMKASEDLLKYKNALMYPPKDLAKC